MFQRLSKVMVGIVAVGALATGGYAEIDPTPQAAQGAAKAKAVKDQGEYDIITAAQKETDPQKKLDVLKQWEQKYPDSDYKDDRTLAQAQAYSQIAAATLAAPTAASMDAGQKAAQVLLDNLDKYFGTSMKPAAVSDADWSKARGTTELQAHTVLGFVAYQRKDDSTAEAEFRKVLAGAPDSAQISYWLGTVIARSKKQERIPEALYHFARAVAVTGPQALDPATKALAEKYLSRAYDGYHGSQDGLPELKATAAKNPMPPDGFTIKSVVDIDKELEGNQAAFDAAHPDIAFWRKIRTALVAADGDTYFTQLKGVGLPPDGQSGFSMFKAKVVSQPSAKELRVSVDSAAAATGDAILKFESPLKTIEAATPIEFKGVVDAFTKEPYTLTMSIVDKADIKGLPPGSFGAAKAAPKTVRKKTK